MPNPVMLGITVIILAIAFSALAVFLLRIVPRIQSGKANLTLPAIPPGITSINDAVLLVQTGGRVIYHNQEAREMFGLLEEDPNLERLARKARPSEVFLGLCASEGEARFSLNGRFVEGTSFFIPYDSTTAVLVSLRRPQVTTLATGDGSRTAFSSQAVDIFTELSQAMAASLDVEKTLQAILESVERLIPSDFPEITIWDPENNHLIPYRFVGLAGLDRHIEKSTDRYHPDEGYSGHLISKHSPLLIGNVDSYRAVRPGVDRKQYPFNSYLGVPLLVAGDLAGTLELASLSKNAFTPNDLEVLRILSGPAAVALHNAIMYQGEQRRVLELSGLAQLSHAVTAIQDPKDLYARLVESIRPLLDVNVIGFWLYDEGKHSLDAQLPFVGIPPQYTDLYHISITPNSPAEEILLSQETIIAHNAPEDPQLEVLELSQRAQAAGYRNTVLSPLASGGRLIGYLQVADKHDGTPFDQDDMRLLSIVTGQSAIIIENATLVQQTQKRAQRAEALRRIASLTGSSATTDEILEFSLREIVHFLQADVAVILLLDENRGDLRIHRESLFGVQADVASRLNKISIVISQSRLASVRAQRSFITANVSNDANILPAYKPIFEALHIQSAIEASLVMRDRGIGEIIIGSYSLNFFDRSDVILIDTTAGQLASAIEQSSLYTQTDESLRRRVDELTALTRISRELNTTLELDHLLRRIYDELLSTTKANCGSILLFEAARATSLSPEIALQIGDSRAQELSELERGVLAREEPLIIEDFQAAPENDQPGLLPPHAGIRSTLIVPIVYQEQMAGLISLHSKSPAWFDHTSQEIAETLAIQAAIALGNAQHYMEQRQRSELLSRRVETLTKLSDTTTALRWDQTLEKSLESIAYGIQESTPFNMVRMSVYDSDGNQLQCVTGAGLTIEQMQEEREQAKPWPGIESLLQPEFCLGKTYFIPAGNTPITPPDVHFLYSNLISVKAREEMTWAGEDRLLVPLRSPGGNLVGLINVDDPRDGLRPDRPTVETLEIFAQQASLTIEGFLRLQEYKRKADSMQGDLSRARKAVEASQEHLPTLLHKDLEQTLAIQRLNQRTRRIRAGLDIAEIVSRQSRVSEVLLVLGREMLTRMDMEAALIAEPTPGGPRLVHSLGNIPGSASPEALLGQRNPLRQCLQNGENLLVANLDENTDWQNSPLLQTLEAKGFICLAIPAEQPKTGHPIVQAAVLAISSNPLAAFTAEDDQLYDLLARQVAVALQNLRLLAETSRRLQEVNMLLEFSRQLGSLDPASILHTLAESTQKLISAADGTMVALWDAKQKCLVPQHASGYPDNASMLQINYRLGEALCGQAFKLGQPLLMNEVDFARHYNLPAENLLRYRKAAGGRLPVSALVVPIGGGVHAAFDSEKEQGSRSVEPLGVIVLENFKVAAAFTSDDQALITSLAQQTALTLENARLYQASEQRAMQLQALTDVAATITSSLQSYELIASLLDQAKPVITYDTGTLWLRQEDQLTIRAARGFADSEERIGISVAVEDSLLLKEMITTGKPIYVPDVREDIRFPSLIEHQYYSWLGVPLISKGEVVGVIALEKTEADFYNPDQIQAVTAFAGQASVALENSNLYEDSVQRAVELDRRSHRLAVLNRLSTMLSGSLDPGYILKLTIQEMLLSVNCSAVSALMFESSGEAMLQAETPQTSEVLPSPLPHAPIFDRLRESMGVYSVENIIDSQDKATNSMIAPLRDYLRSRKTCALLMLPLVTGNALHGILLIHHESPYRFSSEEVELTRTISNQAAVAVQNARLFYETQRLYAETTQRSGELSALYDLGVNLSQMLDREHLIDIVFEKLTALLNIDSVAMVLKEGEEQLTAQIIDRGQKIGPLVMERTERSFSEYVLSSGQPHIFGDVQRDREQLPVPGYTVGDPVRSWMGIPLVVRGSIIGVVSVQSDKADQFNEAHQRLVTQVANQLVVALDNARLFSTVQNYAADLEKRVAERTAQLAREHERTQTLLGIISELSTSLDMDIVLNRTLALINEKIGAEHSLIMLVLPDQPSLFLRASRGYLVPTPSGGTPTPFKHNEGLAGWVITHRQPALVSDLREDERWVKVKDHGSDHRSALAVPLMMGEEVLGTLMLYHRLPDQFSPDQLELVQATAKQIAVAINNSQLYHLIRDQAERLGDMLRKQHIETSRSQAILEAVADGVLVTDSNRIITLFNASAENILGLNRSQVLGRSLEHFLGLFGNAAQQWVQTIRTWSEDPSAFMRGDIHSEQIELEDRRVVSVNLSPVHLRNDFLGTVSTFRDITHQVEVDRLKSEFVATVSHELRTPMTSIKGYVEILLMGAAGTLSEQQAHFLDIVKSNTERLAILVNDLLDISRIEAGRVTLTMQGLDLAEMAEAAVADLQRRTIEESKPMDILMSIPADLPRVFGDKERVRQIIDNLLENAYYYTPDEGHILISMDLSGSEVQIHVKDDGIGILPKDQPRIFERFYRGEDPLVLKTSGTGLGLSIVQRLIDMHQGRIWLESTGVPGEGSVFSFTLPVYEPEKDLPI